MLTISQAAKILGVNKKTLMRWDSNGWLNAKRDPLNNARLYDEAAIRKIERWYDLRKRHKEAVKRYKEANGTVESFFTPIMPEDIKQRANWSEAYASLVKRTKELKIIYEEYGEFTDRMYGHLKK